jgi:hypothetical protein
MGYLHINNLYKDQTILNFREAYALEKLHGTSADFEYFPLTDTIKFSSGGESHDKFVKLFNEEDLKTKLRSLGLPIDKTCTVYGEAYGGKQQGMSATYGKELKFAVFDVQIGDCWLYVEKADELTRSLGLEFVPYEKIQLLKVEDGKIVVNMDEINRVRDLPSRQAKRNGIVEDKFAEGVVLRPLIEVTLNNGNRVICKHKRDEFRETASPRVVDDPAKLAKLKNAEAIADEWVTLERLKHVLDKIPGHDITQMRTILSAMEEDVLREGAGEIELGEDASCIKKAIGTKTAQMYKDYLKNKLAQLVTA